MTQGWSQRGTLWIPLILIRTLPKRQSLLVSHPHRAAARPPHCLTLTCRVECLPVTLRAWRTRGSGREGSRPRRQSAGFTGTAEAAELAADVIITTVLLAAPMAVLAIMTAAVGRKARIMSGTELAAGATRPAQRAAGRVAAGVRRPVAPVLVDQRRREYPVRGGPLATAEAGSGQRIDQGMAAVAALASSKELAIIATVALRARGRVAPSGRLVMAVGDPGPNTSV